MLSQELANLGGVGQSYSSCPTMMVCKSVIVFLCVHFAVAKISEYDYYEEDEVVSNTRRAMVEMTN